MAIIGSAAHLAGSSSVEAVARIRAAVSSPWTDSDGTTWQPDSGYIGGAIHVGGVVPVHDTKDRALYSSHRWGMATYQVPAPCPATYRVGLHFAEVIFTDPGKRVFGVSIEGRNVARNLDVVATVGAMRPLVMRATAEVTDGLLDIDFDRIVEDPMVSAIAVDRVSNCSGRGSPGRPRPDGDVTSTATPTPTSTATPTPIPNPTTTPAETRYPSPADKTPSSLPDAPDAPDDAGGYPDGSNTGVKPGSDLKPSGSIVVTNDRAVLRDLDVTGSIHVLADNVRISNVRIRQPGGIAIRQDPSNHGLVIEDVEIDGRGNPDGSEAIGVANYTLRRANIYGVGEGPRANGNVLVEDSYIHDLGSYLDQGAHQDAIQSTGGSNITIRNNRLENNVDGGNAAIMIGTSPGSNLLIEDNIVSGGGYAVYGGAYEGGGSENWTNVRVMNNRFSTKFYPQSGFYGPLLNVVGVTLSGNVWHETGRPLPS